VDNRHFDPHGFGIGAAATAGLAMGAAVHSIAGNIADAVNRHQEMRSAEEIHEFFAEVLDNNEKAMAKMAEQAAMINLLVATIEHLEGELRRRPVRQTA
jgi:hypothetical protein